MKLTDFDYILPKELIAQYPLKERDNARLLVLERKTGRIEHHVFKDVLKFFNPGDLLVLNNTKVLPCRLFGKKTTGGKAEVFLLGRKNDSTFEALLRPARLSVGDKIIFNGGAVFAEVSGRNEVKFNIDNIDAIYKLGVMPLPPYIKRAATAEDITDYQTVYAREEGAVASPTAGLHFTPQLIKDIEKQGANLAYLTLHVGYGTFKPVKAEDIREHEMEAEHFKVPDTCAKAISEARKNKKRIFAVGTTSLRTLETYAQGKSEGKTNLFIYPGYEFKLADALITNFHLPRTTLFMLVCAFAGEKLAKEAYNEAVKNNYRFYSYGDGMLII